MTFDRAEKLPFAAALFYERFNKTVNNFMNTAIHFTNIAFSGCLTTIGYRLTFPTHTCMDTRIS